MTSREIRTTFRHLLGVEPREADVLVVESLGGTPEALAAYICDHWLGEPDTPSEEEVLHAITEEG